MTYPNLYRLLGHSDVICFFDVEASQYSQKLLSLGGVILPKRRDSFEFDLDQKKEFYFVMKPEKRLKIGKVVESITHLSQDDLKNGTKKEDIEAFLRESLGIYDRIAFVSYGDLDKLVLTRSLFLEDDFLKGEKVHFFDFHKYLSKNLVRENGTEYSISSLMELFSLPMDSASLHNARNDAVYLSEIVLHFLSQDEEIHRLVKEHAGYNRYLKKFALDGTKVYKNL